MGSGFQNAVVGGQNKLVREAIESPNYVPNTSGWAIKKDGSAEFSAALFRGVLELGPASPAPRISASGAADVPATLQNFSADFVWNAAHILWFNGTDYYFWAIGTFVGVGGPFAIEAKGTYDTVHSVLFHEIVQRSGPQIILYGSTTYNSAPLAWNFRNGAVQLDDNCNLGFGTQFDSSRRGWKGAAYTTAGTVATSVGAESAIAGWTGATNPVTFRDGFLYEITVTVGVFNNNAAASPQTSTIRLRQNVNSTVATLLGTKQVETPGLASSVVSKQFIFKVLNTSGANRTGTLGLTIQRLVGANTHGLYGDASIPLSLEVEEVGRSLDQAVGIMSSYIPSVT